jgi:hypothetical protein
VTVEYIPVNVYTVLFMPGSRTVVVNPVVRVPPIVYVVEPSLVVLVREEGYAGPAA